MKNAAVVQGCYVHFEFKSGLKVGRIHIDIPQEYNNLFLKMFGSPDRANPVPVALARLQPDTGAQAPEDNGPDSNPACTGALPDSGAAAPMRESKGEDRPRTPFKDLPRSQQAAIKCQDLDFQQWIGVERARLGLISGAECADRIIKSKLEIGSKKTLDGNQFYADRWDALLTDYDMRDRVR